MGHPRSHFVDPLRTGIYHCISRCVRRESLIESDDRCSWIIAALERLCRVFAIDVCDFAVMRNHVHLLLRTHPELAMAWSQKEVASRWLCRHGHRPEDLEVRVDQACGDPGRIEDWRTRLSDLGWFHKLWKEPAAKAWNRQDEVTGHFWAGRFHSFGCHDESSVLMQAAYILLNPVHCGMESRLGESGRTSLSRRIAKLGDAIRDGIRLDGVDLYRRALLEPAIPCDPGVDAPRLSDSEWSARLTRQAYARAIRESAITDAYSALRIARRSFADPIAGSNDSKQARGETGAVSEQGTSMPSNARRPDEAPPDTAPK